MRKRRLRPGRILRIVAAATGLLFLTPAPAGADHQHGHWHTDRQLRVCVTGSLRAPVVAALDAWRQAGWTNNTYRLECRRWRQGPARLPSNISVFHRSGPFDGRAVIHYAYHFPLTDVSMHLERCVVRINPATPQVNRVVLHEIGHCLGLVHSADPASVMGGGSGISRHDRDAVTAISARHVG